MYSPRLMHSYFYPFCWCGYQCQNQFKYDYVLNRKTKQKTLTFKMWMDYIQKARVSSPSL